jgi:hypothetical protein
LHFTFELEISRFAQSCRHVAVLAPPEHGRPLKLPAKRGP